MRAEVRVVEGQDRHAELVSLRDWLVRDADLRGRVASDRPSDSLQVLVDEGVLTVLAASLAVWIRHRRADVCIEVRNPDGRSVTVNAKRVPDEVTDLVRTVLDGV